ncbi:hypothetical protein [Alloalcanivorax venustensis]|jgi:hypothetical protein|uniref:hypothetical protein n=1 Tax=Alloalcanivorax venustensis TaxID=172371 RepID=UPI003513262A
MKKTLLSVLLGMQAWLLSSVVVAGWEEGPCPQPGTGPAPCFELTDDNDDVWHFNGDGAHAAEWHGHPLGGDLVFSGNNVDLSCSGFGMNCTFSLGSQVKKCQDSNGDWRIGVRITSGEASDGLFCGTIVLAGFPWYSKDPTIPNHCPFEDDCDSLIPYVNGAFSYTANLGAIDMSILASPVVTDGHLNNLVFTPGIVANGEATVDFTNKAFYGCAGDNDCDIDGVAQLSNAKSLYIY